MYELCRCWNIVCTMQSIGRCCFHNIWCYSLNTKCSACQFPWSRPYFFQNAYIISEKLESGFLWINRGIQFQEVLFWRGNFKLFCCYGKSAAQLKIVCVSPRFLEALPSVGSKGMFNFMEENPLFLLMSVELKQAPNILFFLQSCLYQWLVSLQDTTKSF